jgi:serine protease DegS
MKSLSFIFKAGLVGIIAAAVILLWLWPLTTQKSAETPATEPVPAGQDSAPQTALPSGPYSYAAAVERASPSVVTIYTTRIVQQSQNPSINPLLERFFGYSARPRTRKESGLGSGVVFTDNGYILTNYHVIHQAQDVRVLLKDGRDFAAEFVGADPETDLAILRINAQGLHKIPLGESEHLRVGDVVLAIGNPFGVGQTVTMGIISATGRDHLGLNTFENFIQTDAAINPGNSGGALVNAEGELIAVNTAIFSPSGGSLGIGFAIPVDMAKIVLDQIIRHGKVIRGWLGVEGRDVPAHLQKQLPVQGVVVAGIYQNGPADLAGLRPGDIILEINGTAISDTRIMLHLISDNKPGTELAIKYWRNNEFFDTKAKLIQRPTVQP